MYPTRFSLLLIRSLEIFCKVFCNKISVSSKLESANDCVRVCACVLRGWDRAMRQPRSHSLLPCLVSSQRKRPWERG